MPPRMRPNCSHVRWNEFAMDYPPYLRPRIMRDVNTRLANRTFLAKASGLSMASKWMYMSRGESNSQWLCVAVTLIPSLRRREIKGFSSDCKITVSPKHRALPERSMLSKEYACGTNINDSALRPKTIGLIFVRDRVAVQTPLITDGVAFNMAANLLHNSEGCILCIAIIITSRAIYVSAVDLHGMNIQQAPSNFRGKYSIGWAVLLSRFERFIVHPHNLGRIALLIRAIYRSNFPFWLVCRADINDLSFTRADFAVLQR